MLLFFDMESEAKINCAEYYFVCQGERYQSSLS